MLEFSGKQWVTQFEGSREVGALSEPFRGGVISFITALGVAGASVSIGATFRPPERAYLMHWCCMIADSGQDPAAIPTMPGVAIDWTCGGNRTLAKLNAREMKAAYAIQYPAALVSRHTQRLAIDMTITWEGVLKITDKNGVLHEIAGVRNGTNLLLAVVGKTFGVIKLASDAPHWSADGH